MASPPEKASAILSFWKKLPLKVMLVMTVLCLLIQENFPFSDFPMYGSFSSYSYYVYLTDGQDQPIPVEGITGIRTSRLKKIFGGKLTEVRKDLEADGMEIKGYQFMTPGQQRPAGEYTLQWLLDNCKAHARPALHKHRPLRFHKVGLKYQDGEIVKEPAFIAEVP